MGGWVRLGVGLVWTAGGLLGLAGAASAQTPGNERRPVTPSSELGRDNLSRVAASAVDIKAVLAKDTGLMVELKRWVAKEATSHGQIIGEIELSDEAIYDRLQSDVVFRSVATQQLQRYGYLVPQVNPDSAAGKEQELVSKERAKWVAQTQEEDLAAARQRNLRKMQRTDYCDPRSETNCNPE